MVYLKINGVKTPIAQTWSEITLRQFLLMERHRENLTVPRIFSILTGIEYELVINFDLRLFDPIMTGCVDVFDDKTILSSLLCPDHIHIGGKKVRILKNMRRQCAGQFFDLQDDIRTAIREKRHVIEIFPRVIARFVQPEYDEVRDTDKPYNPDRVDHIEKLAEDLPVTIGYPVANFFLTRHKSYLRQREKPSLLSRLKTKSRQVSESLSPSDRSE